jgi:hypothetical protein
MLAEARFIVDIGLEGLEGSSDSGSSSLVGHFQDTFRRRRNFLFLIPSGVFEGGAL